LCVLARARPSSRPRLPDSRSPSIQVLLTPGSYYVIPAAKSTTSQRGAEPAVGFFRFAFSYNDRVEMEEGIRRVEEVASKLWGY